MFEGEFCVVVDSGVVVVGFIVFEVIIYGCYGFGVVVFVLYFIVDVWCVGWVGFVFLGWVEYVECEWFVEELSVVYECVWMICVG